LKSVSFSAAGNGDAGVIALQNRSRRDGDQPALDNLKPMVGAIH